MLALLATAGYAQHGRLLGRRRTIGAWPLSTRSGQGDHVGRGRWRHGPRGCCVARWAAGLCAHLWQLRRGTARTDGQTMVVIDIAQQKWWGPWISDTRAAAHAHLRTKNGLLYVTTELDHTVTIIDPKTLKILGSIPTGQPETTCCHLARRPARLHGQRGAGHGFRAGHGRAQDDQSHSHFQQYATHLDFEGRPVGVYRRPDQAAPGGD